MTWMKPDRKGGGRMGWGPAILKQLTSALNSKEPEKSGLDLGLLGCCKGTLAKVGG